MKKITHVIIHCSDSKFGNAALINEWHIQRGFAKIGYHYVILNGRNTSARSYISLNDGVVEIGRHLDDDSYMQSEEIGAHALGFNDCSVGICLIGVNMFSEFQLISLLSLIKEMRDKYNIPIENIIGHYEIPQANGKTCPNFNLNKIRTILRDDEEGKNVDLLKYFDKGDFNFI